MGNAWCAPIPNCILEEKLESYLAQRKFVYAAIFHYSIITSMEIKDILELKVSDVKGKDRITIQNFSRGTNEYTTIYDKRTIEIINTLCRDKNDTDFLFTEPKKKSPIKQSSLNRNLKTAGEAFGISNLSAISLRKTHFLHVYKAYGIQRVAKLLGHTSTKVTYQYLGIKQNNESCYSECKEREALLNEHCGQIHIANIITTLESISDIIEKPSTPDAFYSDLYRDLTSIERLLVPYKKYTDSLSKEETPE